MEGPYVTPRKMGTRKLLASDLKSANILNPFGESGERVYSTIDARKNNQQ